MMSKIANFAIKILYVLKLFQISYVLQQQKSAARSNYERLDFHLLLLFICVHANDDASVFRCHQNQFQQLVSLHALTVDFLLFQL